MKKRIDVEAERAAQSVNQIQIFKFERHAVRIAVADPSAPEWVAKDVCDVLDLTNPRQALTGLDDDEKGSVIIADGSPGNPEHSTVTEAGLYKLILRSRKPAAKAFARWVTHEVLPSIRRTGSYSTHPQPVTDPGMVQVLTMFGEQLRAQTELLKLLIDQRSPAASATHVIGRSNGKKLCKRLRELAEFTHILYQIRSVKSWRGSHEANLRCHLNYLGLDARWELLPAALQAKAIGKLDEIERELRLRSNQSPGARSAAPSDKPSSN